MATRTSGRTISGKSPRAALGLGLALLALAGGGCARPAQSPAAQKAALEIVEPRANLMSDMGSVYLTVVDHGGQGDRLLRVETAAAARAETHESLVENGVVRMVARPEGFAVPAGGRLALEPGGKHVMLFGARAPAPGAATLPLTLHFERAGAIAVEAALARSQP